jgi:hypothetical protein
MVNFSSGAVRHCCGQLHVPVIVFNRGTFDASDPRILYQPGESDQRRGSFTPSNMEIRFLAQADRSTAFHELGHFFLHATLEMASRPGAPKRIVDDANAILAKAWELKGRGAAGATSFGQASRRVPKLGDAMPWREFGEYLSKVKASDAFGRVSAREKREWAAAGGSWRLIAVDPVTLEPVGGEVSVAAPIIVATDGGVIDGRHRRAAAARLPRGKQLHRAAGGV